MTLHARYINGNVAYYDTYPHRIVHAFGSGVVKFEDDFVQTPFDGADNPAAYTTTLVEAGAGETTVALLAGEAGGALLVTTDANDNDGANIQAKGEAFKFVAGQPLYFGIKLKMSEVVQSDFMVGLSITDTDMLGGITDGTYFRKVDGSAAVTGNLEKNSTETNSATLLTAVADTYYTLEFYWDGAALDLYIDGVVQTRPVLTNLCDDEELTPSMHFLTGEAVVHTFTVAWMRCFQFLP